jgi:16S rRNA (cytosine1402-N4)-methyltransferase
MYTPVLLQEVIKFLEPKPGEFIIDGTVGGGGHAIEIAKRISPDGTLLAVDWDKDTLEETKLKIEANFQFPRLRPPEADYGGQAISNFQIFWIYGNYADLPEILKDKKLGKADGLLLDLGFSSEQLEKSGKGFSFLKDEPLLMTYDRNQKPVKEILNELGEEELARIIREFGEERFAKRISKAIVAQRKIKPIESSGELSRIVKNAVPKNYEHGRIHPATRTFQALRIYANDELENLEKILKAMPIILKPEGRAVITSFHSLEDRLVKNYMRRMEKENILKILAPKPIRPSPEEIKNNPRSRSAKLRAAVMI